MDYCREGRGSYLADDLRAVDQKSQKDGVKILFLGEATVAIRLSLGGV